MTFREYLEEAVEDKFLTEALDSDPLKWSIVKDSLSDTVYKFEAGGNMLAVFFRTPMKESGLVDVSFGLLDKAKGEMTFSMTHTGNQFAILATVADTIRDYIGKKDPNGIKFTATKEIIADKDSKSRASVYHRMLKKFMPGSWKIDMKDTGHEIKFEARKG